MLMSVLESSQNHGHRGSELMEFAKGIMLSDSDVVSLYQNSINKFCHGMRDVLLCERSSKSGSLPCAEATANLGQ